MDETDARILELLKKNARMTYVEIGEAVGLSEGAVRNRVQALATSGVIKRFTIETTVGARVRSITMISVEPGVPTNTVSQAVLRLPGAERVYEVTGEYDIFAIVALQDIEGVNQCIEEIRKIKGVVKTNSVIVLRTLEL